MKMRTGVLVGVSIAFLIVVIWCFFQGCADSWDRLLVIALVLTVSFVVYLGVVNEVLKRESILEEKRLEKKSREEEYERKKDYMKFELGLKEKAHNLK